MNFIEWLSTFFVNKSTQNISLETDEAYDILKETDDNQQTDDIVDDEDSKSNITKTGTITKRLNTNTFMIDDFYKIESDLNLTVGTKISYQLIKANGEIQINDINIIQRYWESNDDDDDDDTVNRPVVETPKTSARRLTLKVENRIGRQLLLSPNKLSIDLNNIPSQFIPIVGDWICLDVIVENDENQPDSFGDIIEIINLSPSLPKLSRGKITQWNRMENFGVIDQQIYFDKDSLCSAFVPILNDSVIAETIESNQGLYSRRAIKVISDAYYEKRLKTNSIKSIDQLTNNLKDNHPNIEITENIIINLIKLDDMKLFTIDITNKTLEDLALFEIETDKTGSQITIITEVNRVEILKGETFTIKCECFAVIMGESKELLILNFGDFRIKRWITINVGEIVEKKKSSSKFRQYRRDIIESTNSELIRGQRLSQPARFISTRIPDYAVPKNLLKIVENYSRDTTKVKLEIERVKPVLTTRLTHLNYEEYFHTLIHLDEIHAVLSMRNYDQPRACFLKYAEYLVLKIENLIDRRPTIIVGDRVIAHDIHDASKPAYEGYIHKIIDNDVYIKFAQSFHNSYDSEDYMIKVVASRTTYKREHYAISLAVKNLGKDLLFPSKVNEKPPQINCIINHGNIEKITDDYQFELKLHNKNLNEYQRQAVHNSLLGICRPLPYIIFGPPGTGKSVTIVEIVLQILRLIPHARILLTAPSNSAADLLALKLIDSGVVIPGDLVRFLAYTAIHTVSPRLLPYCATANFEKPGTETHAPIATSNGLTLGCNAATLGRHRVTVCTCSCAGSLYFVGFPKGHFTHIIVDEAGQTSEPSIMIPLSFMDVKKGQAILAGDPMQLRPVIISSLAAHYGLHESYLERMITRFPYLRDVDGFPKSFGYDPRLITKLIYNYRSLPRNLKISSYLFYNDDLIPTISETDSKETEILKKLESILPRTKDNRIASIVFHSVIGEDRQKEDSPSWMNPREAARVFNYVNEFYRLGLSVADIGIITPYKAQSKHIQNLHRDAEFNIPKIGTVEDFQGQEFNVIIMSTVRSSEVQNQRDLLMKLGFLMNPRRINVAITRAKALLIIIGNPHLLKYDKIWQTVIEYCRDRGGFIE